MCSGNVSAQGRPPSTSSSSKQAPAQADLGGGVSPPGVSICDPLGDMKRDNAPAACSAPAPQEWAVLQAGSVRHFRESGGRQDVDMHWAKIRSPCAGELPARREMGTFLSAPRRGLLVIADSRRDAISANTSSRPSRTVMPRQGAGEKKVCIPATAAFLAVGAVPSKQQDDDSARPLSTCCPSPQSSSLRPCCTMSSFGDASHGKGGAGSSYRHSNYNHPSPTRSNSQSSTGLPTPAASPQSLSPTAQNYSMLSSSPSHAQQQPRRLHNMSISSILSPDSSHRTQNSVAEAGRTDTHGAKSDTRIHPPMTFNEDPQKINLMLDRLNPDSAEWVVWKEWSEWLADGKPVDKAKMARWIAEEEAAAKEVRARNAALKMESST
ncbi:hypothetical protein IWZ03DRAFT_428066 [Phyllosticta citriasiana]|uniref:Uncharacterized protein n=1 Tax=Phyllosticta citriasiana TaxID=595635 RepID=A0ABR1KXN0_9PEZI